MAAARNPLNADHGLMGESLSKLALREHSLVSPLMLEVSRNCATAKQVKS